MPVPKKSQSQLGCRFDGELDDFAFDGFRRDGPELGGVGDGNLAVWFAIVGGKTGRMFRRAELRDALTIRMSDGRGI